jgi:hypothetical protein
MQSQLTKFSSLSIYEYEQIEKEYRKIILFTIASKNKIPTNKLNKDVKYCYMKYYKVLKKKMEVYYRRWKELMDW